jgi:hypothetical protein
MENSLTHTIENRIFMIRGKQVMFDRDLANLFDVEARAMNQAVKRNAKRFPIEFMFQLDAQEFAKWKSQIVTSKNDKMGLRKRSYVFTEQGIAMLSTVLRSTIAIEVSIRIMNVFVALREQALTWQFCDSRFRFIENTLSQHEQNFEQLFSRLEKHQIPQHGIFFNNQIFDAYVFFSELIERAKTSIILIDNYIDHKVLLQLAKRKKNVTATIYTERISAALSLDLEKHNEQYSPIEMHPIQNVHDRFLVIDENELYHIGASIKDLGKRWFAFSRMDSLTEQILERIQRVKL